MTTVDPRNNCGDIGVPGLSVIANTREEDMLAFDQLGPAVRKVINFDLGVKWSATETLRYIRLNLRSEPSNPMADSLMADMLRAANRQILRTLAV